MVIFAEKMRRAYGPKHPSGFLKATTFILHSFEFLFHIMIQATFEYTHSASTHYADGVYSSREVID